MGNNNMVLLEDGQLEQVDGGILEWACALAGWYKARLDKMRDEYGLLCG